MAVIAHTAFPNAILTLDCFHIMKRCIDGVEEIRLRYRREARAEQRRLELEHRAAGQQGVIDVEIGILGGAGDHGDLAVLQKLQQALLLLLVEVLDLIQI